MQQDTSFRDSLATVDDEGKRKWIYPKKPAGKYYNYRQIVAYLLLLLLFLGPFVRVNDNPLLLFNILERKFILFGSIFYPQDFYIFMFTMVVGIIAIGVFTLVFGRLFCGWVCPQTIFMEMVFRKIEYWIEGDWSKQKALNKQEMNAKKLAKKTLKHFLFFTISFIISNTFLAYIIGSDELLMIISSPPTEHWAGFVSIVLFAFIFYLVFSHLREQICTSVCPYGRLQGVLLDKYSIVVAYDYERGEERAKFRKNEDRASQGKGDCVDCKQCVNVCPTGIDIRNGTQLECIHCTACMDACDSIMEKLAMPGGLIRYTSEHHIKNKTPLQLNKRSIGFSALLIVLVGIMFSLLFFRNQVDTKILRTPGVLTQQLPDNKLSNLYNFTITNKVNKDLELRLIPKSTTASVQLIGNPQLLLPANEKINGSFFLILPAETLTARETKFVIETYAGEDLLDESTITFFNQTNN